MTCHKLYLIIIQVFSFSYCRKQDKQQSKLMIWYEQMQMQHIYKRANEVLISDFVWPFQDRGWGSILRWGKLSILLINVIFIYKLHCIVYIYCQHLYFQLQVNGWLTESLRWCIRNPLGHSRAGFVSCSCRTSFWSLNLQVISLYFYNFLIFYNSTSISGLMVKFPLDSRLMHFVQQINNKIFVLLLPQVDPHPKVFNFSRAAP